MRIITSSAFFLAVGLSFGMAPAKGATNAPSLTAASSKPPGSLGCSEVALTQKPGWALSGGFTPDGSQLLVVDALYRSILRYSASGRSMGPVSEPIKTILKDRLPANGRFRGNDFILEVSDGLMVLDKALRPTGTKRVQPRDEVLTQASKDWKIGGFWQWEPVGDGDVVAFVDLVHEDPTDLRNWKTGFVRFGMEGSGVTVLGDTFDLTGTANKGYYRSGYQYIAALGNTAYYLSMNDGVRLYKQEKGQKPIDVSSLLPRSLKSPPLPDWFTMSEYVDMMGQIEKEALPVGLYGWKDSLYLLYRERKGERTQWELYKIDPSGKRPYQMAPVQIRGEHVTVIPGPQQWAILEKGSVLGYGAQDIPRLLFIPSSLLEAPLRSGNTLCR